VCVDRLRKGWLTTTHSLFRAEQADGRREPYLVTRQGEERRLTYSAGLAGPRHWPRVGPDGRIAVLMKDAAGIVQVFTVTRNGETVQLTQEPCDVEARSAGSGDQSRTFAKVAFVSPTHTRVACAIWSPKRLNPSRSLRTVPGRFASRLRSLR
jgi:hypothetical protein